MVVYWMPACAGMTMLLSRAEPAAELAGKRALGHWLLILLLGSFLASWRGVLRSLFLLGLCLGFALHHIGDPRLELVVGALPKVRSLLGDGAEQRLEPADRGLGEILKHMGADQL